jgi:hypothetical protein
VKRKKKDQTKISSVVLPQILSVQNVFSKYSKPPYIIFKNIKSFQQNAAPTGSSCQMFHLVLRRGISWQSLWEFPQKKGLQKLETVNN